MQQHRRRAKGPPKPPMLLPLRRVNGTGSTLKATSAAFYAEHEAARQETSGDVRACSKVARETSA